MYSKIAFLAGALAFLSAQVSADCPDDNCCAPEIVAPTTFYGLYSFNVPNGTNTTELSNGKNETEGSGKDDDDDDSGGGAGKMKRAVLANSTDSEDKRNYFETLVFSNSSNCFKRIDTIASFQDVKCSGETHWYPSLDFSYQPNIKPDNGLNFSSVAATILVEQITQSLPENVTYASTRNLDTKTIGTFRLPGNASDDYLKAQLIHIGQVPCQKTLNFRFSAEVYRESQYSYNYYPSCPISGVGLRYGCCQYSQDCL